MPPEDRRIRKRTEKGAEYGTYIASLDMPRLSQLLTLPAASLAAARRSPAKPRRTSDREGRAEKAKNGSERLKPKTLNTASQGTTRTAPGTCDADDLQQDRITPAKQSQERFQLETLLSNRTSSRANTINFAAHAQAMPRLRSTPSSVTAGQRRDAPTAPSSVHRKLTKEAAARLLNLRHPYRSPSLACSRSSQEGAEAKKLPEGKRRMSSLHSGSVASGSQQKPSAGRRLPVEHRARSSSPAVTYTRRSPSPEHEPHLLDAVPPVRVYKLTGMTNGHGDVRQLITKRVDYRTQATPAPATQNGVKLFITIVNDEYSDSQDGVMDDYDPHARALAIAHAYAPDGQLDGNDSESNAARTVYDNDYDVDEPEVQSEHQMHNFHSSPMPSVVSYAEDVASQDDHAADHDHLHSEYGLPPTSSPYRKARRIAEPLEGRQRPRKSDYEPQAQEVIRDAVVIFKSLICSRDAYPNKLLERSWASEAWQQAALALDIKLAPNTETLNIIMQYSWNLRGEIKNVARSLVPAAYSFKAGITARSRVYNQERAAFLRRGHAFVYEVMALPFPCAADHVGLYEAEVIQAVINRVFYKSATDEGIVLARVYDPFPIVGLALVLTAVECAIDEWESGVFTKVKFSEEKYSSMYKVHLQELCAFEEESGADRIVNDICTNISARGR
ncbi:hypothetical protein BN946_scf184807.g2 [Trametes cinnabarina]|uniref:DUF6532 domain-containing protein n=1 Tax=Pycnoporus cinnabarinus TaxID=5643 RepID=A0A060SQT4_PYCCI|nr:hypothetical protein BN946_scf184807.g2 [Trametes cinnabarina]